MLLDPSSLCHKLSHLLGPPRPFERDLLYGRPLLTQVGLNRLSDSESNLETNQM